MILGQRGKKEELRIWMLRRMDKTPLVCVIISAALFGISPPLAKLLVGEIPPVVLAGLLYLGAFTGLTLYSIIDEKRRAGQVEKAAPLERKDLPWLAGAVITGGILGPVSLMTGLTLVSGFTASLLLNLEGVATAIIAVFLFKENAGKRVWLALAFMTLAGVLLAWDTGQGGFNIEGPLLVAFAMVCWGVDNNLTRNISDKDPIQIARIKGLAAGAISISLAFISGISITLDTSIVSALLLGAFSYGISLVLFIKALRGLGSSRAGAFFSIAPFMGAITSLVLLREWLGWVMLPAATLMVIGVWLITSEKHSHTHLHKKTMHAHAHKHDDMHHMHMHSGKIHEPHAHKHTHHETTHTHTHWPDTHHRHEHPT